jgi:hypothetical protein
MSHLVVRVEVGGRFVQRHDAAVQAKRLGECKTNHQRSQHLRRF